MFRIKAKLIADRVSVARAGSRARRQPVIVLGTGAVVKLAPGRSVDVTPEVYKANTTLLNQFSDMITVESLLKEPFTQPSKLATPIKVDPSVLLDPETKFVVTDREPEIIEPAVVDPVVEQAVEQDPVEEKPVEQEPAEAITPEQPAEEKPKKKRRRKKDEVETESPT